jgi:hypothetical protein
MRMLLQLIDSGRSKPLRIRKRKEEPMAAKGGKSDAHQNSRGKWRWSATVTTHSTVFVGPHRRLNG